ncbi:glycoside hydrolase family 30 protein [Streptomyces aidingensis]|uniref:Glucosylceramidase n=1 Tax=Streptomyces aidingensis TaxID=910347 RepID=A0A1I1JKG0_9ACTN|nr:glycoside hydrolase family 30 protein [Streptomyces aidingensis]SFC49037.1 glucosylceramidase [Streptomyces aidingensis]
MSRIVIGRDSLQTIDGFGFCQAFQRARVLRELPEQARREVLNLLMSPRTGAGFSILRLGIGSSPDYSGDQMKSIQPADPGGPDAPPAYEWDGDDGGQLWLAKEAKAYGIRRFYVSAWSAPGYMKDNGTDAHGGKLLPEWYQAYARYLLRYAGCLRQEGIPVTELGFTNEPDFTVDYASMRFTPAELAAYVKVIGPQVRRAGLRLVTADSYGWGGQRAYTEAVEADPVARELVDIHAGHPYEGPVDRPLPTSRPTWMSEWSPDGETWNEAWDDGSGYDGFAVASQIHDSFTLGQVSGYVYWFGASMGTTRAPIRMAGGGYRVAKRLWALAGWSRHIRPHAVRVPTACDEADLKITAFRNADGGQVLVVLNAGRQTVRAEPGLDGEAYVTDEERSLAAAGEVRESGKFAFAPRSLTTIVTPA